jgi:MFS family permease
MFALAAAGDLAVSHLVIGGLVSGIFWAGEMSIRRRMVSEVVETGQVGQAIALDSVTGSLTRMLGPLLGGALYEAAGVPLTYLVAALLHLASLAILWPLPYRADARRLDLVRIPAEIAEGIAIVRGAPILTMVVLVTIITNIFAFCYSALVAPLGIESFAVSPFLVGVLAAAEPCGAMTSGLFLAAGFIRLEDHRLMLRGAALLFAAVALAAVSPAYPLAVLALFAGGLGSAVFSSMQSTLVLTHAPPDLRSRVMGLVTVSIGTGPFGILAAGLLSETAGPGAALLALALTGAALLALVWLRRLGPAR